MNVHVDTNTQGERTRRSSCRAYICILLSQFNEEHPKQLQSLLLSQFNEELRCEPRRELGLLVLEQEDDRPTTRIGSNGLLLSTLTEPN